MAPERQRTHSPGSPGRPSRPISPPLDEWGSDLGWTVVHRQSNYTHHSLARSPTLHLHFAGPHGITGARAARSSSRRRQKGTMEYVAADNIGSSRAEYPSLPSPGLSLPNLQVGGRVDLPSAPSSVQAVSCLSKWDPHNVASDRVIASWKVAAHVYRSTEGTRGTLRL